MARAKIFKSLNVHNYSIFKLSVGTKIQVAYKSKLKWASLVKNTLSYLFLCISFILIQFFHSLRKTSVCVWYPSILFCCCFSFAKGKSPLLLCKRVLFWEKPSPIQRHLSLKVLLKPELCDHIWKEKYERRGSISLKARQKQCSCQLF